MKKCIIFLTLIVDLAFCIPQDEKTIQFKIDSLETDLRQLNKKLSNLSAELTKWKNVKENTIKIKSSKGKYIELVAQNQIDMLSAPSNLDGKKIQKIEKGDTVRLLDFEESFFTIAYKSLIGYAWEFQIYTFLSPLERQKIDIFKKEQIDAHDKIEKKRRQQQSEKAMNEKKRRLSLLYGETIVDRIVDGKIWIGMTKEMALESWGKPANINRTVNAYVTHEQWVYGLHTYLYFDNNCLTSWQD